MDGSHKPYAGLRILAQSYSQFAFMRQEAVLGRSNVLTHSTHHSFHFALVLLRSKIAGSEAVIVTLGVH
jgi:hypothetical protein